MSEVEILHETEAQLSPRYEPDFFRVTNEIRGHVPNKVSRVLVEESEEIENGKLYKLEFGLYFQRENGKPGGKWLKKKN